MGEDDGEQARGAQVDEGGVGAEEGRVAELEKGAGEGRWQRGVGVGDAELVEVVDVGEAED